MNKELARDVRDALLDCSGKLDRSVSILEEVTSEQFVRRYRRLVGAIMGEFYVEVLRDLYREHPDLEPETMK